MIARRDVPDAITKYERDGGHLRAGGPDRWPDLLLAGQRVGQIAHQLDAPFLRHVPVTVADNRTHIEAPGLNLLRVQPAARTRG